MENHLDKILDPLNPEQKEAVLYSDGPCLVIAGAGSGKTRVLTHKIAYIHEKYDVPLSHILAVTFTNKAAREMVSRVEKLVGSEGLSPYQQWVLTFHSFANRILQRYADRLGYQRGFAVYDSTDQVSCIKRIMNDLELDQKTLKPTSVLYTISAAKNKLIDADKYIEKAHNYYEEMIGKIYVEYARRLKQQNAMDFDDLLVNVLELFRTQEDILQKYQKQFEFILIDEYQDINMPQYMMAFLLSNRHRRLFAVGDSDQNIYSWRGANIQNILNFEKDFPDAKVILLEQNYRSTNTILQIANHVIRHNQLRKDKNLWTENGDGEKAMVFAADNEYDEAEFVARQIKQDMERGGNPSEMAVLYRINAQSRVLEELCLQYNIRYRIFGGQRFYDRKEIKDILSYLRLMINPVDDTALMRIINIPARKIGKLSVERLSEKAKAEGISMYEAIDKMQDQRCYAAMMQFKAFINAARSMVGEQSLTLPEIIQWVLKESGYRHMLNQEQTPEAQTRIENLNELIAATAESDYTLEEFLTLSALMTDQDQPDSDEPYVTLMTLHSAKGLEFDNVYLTGFEDRLLPHFQSMEDAQELEEERRLCYVGITRARKKLYISFASRRSTYYDQGHPQDVSRFFFEIPKVNLEVRFSPKLSPYNHLLTVLQEDGYGTGRSISKKHRFTQKNYDQPDENQEFDFTNGDHVLSPTFGQGIVVNTFGKGRSISLQIQFDRETKLIMPKYGKLQKI